METTFRNIKLINIEEDIKLYNLLFEKTSRNRSFSFRQLSNEEIIFPSSNLGFEIIYNKNGYCKRVEYKITKMNWENEEDLKAFFEDIKDILEKSVQNVPKLATRFGRETIQIKDLHFYQCANEHHIASVNSLLYFNFLEKIKNKKEYCILDFGIDIFIRLADTQHLPNGNKRNAVLFLISFLQTRNIYLLFSWNINKEYLDSWEEIVTIAATHYYQKKIIDEFGELIDFEPIGEKIDYEELHSYIKKHILSIAYIKI
ncbi:hypothetical protein [Spiroplasma endosymbiont of Cantharis lateralis]|uniref:hypothetical protein n=1 Tax=Spiroplasma endosymbiont of Cantharis lateralis TaxID=3066277 RepID=UPI00313EF83B